MGDSLTVSQAYMAVYAFLEKQYSITKEQAYGMLLSDMSLLSDGTSADPAILEDWKEAVEKALSGSVAVRMKLL